MPSLPPTSHDDSAANAGGGLLGPNRIGPALELGSKRLRFRVALGFFLIAAAPGIAGGPARMALCGGIVFLALTLHELGHAVCALACGSRATVVLHVLGAHTVIEPALSRRHEVLSALMGPIVSLIAGLVLAIAHWHFPAPKWLAIAMWVNLAWGGVNLLPVLPFDGGRALLALVGDKRRSSALLVSGAFALVIAVEGLVVLRSAPIAFLFGVASCVSLFGWSRRRSVEIEQALELPQQLEKSRGLLAAGEAERARQLATRVGVRARSNVTANAAWEIVAWAELELGRADEAYYTLGRVRPASAVPSYALAAVQAARGETRRALGLLERLRSSEQLGVDAIKLLIDLHARVGSLEGACAVASTALSALDPEDTRRVIEAAFEADAFAPATKLAGELFAATGSPDDAVTHAYGLARLGDRTSARRIFRQLVLLLSDWQMHKRTLARLRDLATRPDLSELIGPELSHLALAPAPG